MESISRDARAFQELADEDNSQKDFSKFSKLELPASVIIENSVSTFPVKLCKAINMSTESEKVVLTVKLFTFPLNFPCHTFSVVAKAASITICLGAFMADLA